jgi:hypothetical protein
MSGDTYIEQFYPIKCRGRNVKGEVVLAQPVDVKVKIYKSPGCDTISSLVDCPHVFGPHSDSCGASYAEAVKEQECVGCPYSFDIPFATEKHRDS